MTSLPEQDPERNVRVRTLTEKGQQQYDDRKLTFLQAIESSHRILSECKSDFDPFPESASRFRFAESSLRLSYERYERDCNAYFGFLSNTRSTQSNTDLNEYWPVFKKMKSSIYALFDKIDQHKVQTLETASHTSGHTASHAGSVSSHVARKRAKAEAAKAKLNFAEEQARLMEEQTKVKVKLDLLSQKAEVAAAVAEADYLEQESLGRHSRSPSLILSPPKESMTPFDKTMRYLDDLSLNANAQPFVPHAEEVHADNSVQQEAFFQPEPKEATQQPLSGDLARYLLKKEIMIHKFRNFNDKPEHYIAWKAEFRNLIQDLQCSPVEELGLLTSHLGPESTNQAMEIRTSCADNPELCLNTIWTRLEERFGSPELVEIALKTKLQSFPKLTDMKKLYNLHDILTEIETIKRQPQFKDIFSYFDSSVGVKPIVQKLPHALQEKWITRAAAYKNTHKVIFPPFSEFVKFVAEMSRIRNDPGLVSDFVQRTYPRKDIVSVKKLSLDTSQTTGEADGVKGSTCILHKNSKHSTNECRAFRKQPIEERKTLLKEANICFRCCETSDHFRKKCKAQIKCTECNSKYHCTALHDDKPRQNHGEEETKPLTVETVSTKCTEICGEFNGKSCAKILPIIVYPKGRRTCAMTIYAMLDDQSNKTLAKGKLFDEFCIGSTYFEYVMNTCSGRTTCYGRTTNQLVVESLDGQTVMNLPHVLECEDIPENYAEVPTPDVTRYYAHLNDLESKIKPLDKSLEILLLIGRDFSDAHIVLDQRTGLPNTPFAQRLPLGWTIIGEACLSGQHIRSSANTYKTFVCNRSSLFEPCEQYLHIRTTTGDSSDDLFHRSPHDNKPGPSIEDCQFLKIMQKDLHLDDKGHWIAPLPFRVPRRQLPNNYSHALRRAKTLDSSLMKNELKREHFIAFMQKLFDNGHAEPAPPLPNEQERWYLPLFGVYHPHKPHQIRGVFDSSAKHEGISLNDVLLQGPDLANNLLGVLIRFRREMIAVVGDIQHMFHCFVVREKDRDYLRFLWHRDNKLENELVEFRMRVHVFGNRPSPSIANYGLLKIAALSTETHGPDVRDFITHNFYVDDGLISISSTEKAISLIKDTQDALKTHGGLRLHKFASNDLSVMRAFNPEDLAKDVLELDFEKDVPLQRSLGLVWSLHLDSFQFHISSEPKPLSRRGVLSVVNSVYDPLGFLSPITIFGKIILRKIVASTSDWDEPLPDSLAAEWNTWKTSLFDIEDLRIPRVIVPDLSASTYKELLIYSDASELAISAVAYLRVRYKDSSTAIGFVLGKSKVAPASGHTIPRLELCAAVLAVDIAQIVQEHLQVDIDSIRYFTDSRVVLGYISNEKKRFFMYVANRVAHIRNLSEPHQWSYVNTSVNPADVGTRGISPKDLENSLWLSGPNSPPDDSSSVDHPLVDPEADNEVRCKASDAELEIRSGLGSHRFSRFSSWNSLVEAIALLQRFIDYHKGKTKELSKKTVESYNKAEFFVIKTIQAETLSDELECLRSSKPLPRHSHILTLDPVLDDSGIIRVGGRLKLTKTDSTFKHPILIPGNHYVATLLVRKHHTDVYHQGRHLTEGRVRSSGVWITGCKRLVSSVIHKCVVCRKLRGNLAAQKMSDLPVDRVTPGQPPFTSVGIDIFGPWEVVTRRTRGGSANSKRWAALFTCMATRAVHIEVIEEMSSSSFINALRRFTALRGKVQIIRSDRGTNFIGAVSPLQMNAVNVEDGPISDFLHKNGTTWIFNAPHSSHMGGVWERMIGITRRILDSMLLDHGSRTLTHEVLVTFLAEASSIINSRPLIPISSDTNSPFILTPAILLTQKTDSDSVSEGDLELDQKDLLRKQWQRVQYLSSLFWKRWQSEYLQTLQCRRKWHNTQRNISNGDVVLLRDKDNPRNQWPMGVVIRVFPSKDERVRKVELQVVREGKIATFVRPVHELVVLLES